ncbi:hypothetical protein [[Kitasatospora] papulosa]|uniref:hypothetical protein n=1 Tax=[Kitasatospora] papulosa TaxID=1464011 RepID=UPI0036E2B2B7
MSWLRMNIQNGQVSGELEMDQVGSNETMAIVNGFFGTFGLQPKVQRPELAHDITTPKIVISSPIQNKQTVKEVVKDIVLEKASINKPPLLNSERTLAVPIGEQLAEAYKNMDSGSLEVISKSTETNEQPEDYKVTGIKFKEGVAHYRCRYWCKNPECRNKGNHYILPDTHTVDCHNCGTELEVREAIHGEPMSRDSWGNFFIADHLA